MPRYVNQRQRGICGPIAIINAAKWSGLQITLSDLQAVKQLCRCDPQNGGTLVPRFDKILRHYCQVVKRLEDCPKRVIDRHLAAGGSVVLCYDWWKSPPIKISGFRYKNHRFSGFKFGGITACHFMFIPERRRGGYCLVNPHDGYEAVEYVSNQRFIRSYWAGCRGERVVWLIQRLSPSWSLVPRPS